MELTYLPAQASDADQIYSLCKDLILTYEDPAEIDLDRALKWSRRKIQTQIGNYTRIVLEGSTAGWFCLSPQEGEMELDDFYILPQFRGKGIGTAVLEKCIRESSLPIFLCVFTQNTGALNLYLRMGFRVAQQISATRSIMRREVL